MKKKKQKKKNFNKTIILVTFIFLFIIVIILGIKQLDSSYVNKYNLKISNFENNFILKGYLSRIDNDTNQTIYGDSETTDVTYNILSIKEESSSTKGYTKLTLEYEVVGNTYFEYDKNGKARDMGYYSFFTLDFFDRYTGEQFFGNLNESYEKTIKYKNNEYVIYYNVLQGVSNLETEWTGVNMSYFIREVCQKYIVTFEYPKEYDGLLIGATGASDGYINDMNVAKALSKKEHVYIKDTYNSSTKLFDIKDVISSLN